MPTVDAENEADRGRAVRRRKEPVWRSSRTSSGRSASRGTRESGRDGPVSAELLEPVLEVVARRAARSRNGHLAAPRSRWPWTRARAGVRRRGRDAPRLPDPGPAPWTEQELADRGRFSSGASPRFTRGRSRGRQIFAGDPRDGRRAERALDRPRPDRQPTRRGWTRSHGRRASRGRLRRGGDPYDDGANTRRLAGVS